MKSKTMPRWGKILLGIGITLLALVLVLGIAIYAVWHNELATAFSITQLRTRNDDHQDGSVYTMQVHGGFYLDEFVAQGGVSSDAELISFITGNITKGLLDLGMESPEIGCSAFTAQTPGGGCALRQKLRFLQDQHLPGVHGKERRPPRQHFHR